LGQSRDIFIGISVDPDSQGGVNGPSIHVGDTAAATVAAAGTARSQAQAAKNDRNKPKFHTSIFDTNELYFKRYEICYKSTIFQ
jgi:hypothetical protein